MVCVLLCRFNETMTFEHRDPLLNAHSSAEESSEPRSRKSTYHGLNYAEHDSRYGRLPEPALSWQNRCERLSSRLTSRNLAQWLQRRFPVFDVFRTYRFRKFVIGDIIAGLSVGIVNIPQSLGYARLADVPVILGLYTSVFPVFVYFIFGSSRHVSIGTMALSCLVIAEAVKSHGFQQPAFSLNETSAYDEVISDFTLEELHAISVAVSVSFLAGIFLILMSIFHLGFIVSYMAEPFISGYLGANCVRILTHQVRDMLGIAPTKGYAGPGEYFYTLSAMLYRLPSANLLQILISVLCIATLVLVKKCINERFASRMKFPIPVDIIVVIIFTLASHFGQLEEKFGVKVLKTVPKGIPAMTIPSVEIMWNCIYDSFMLGIVSYMMVGMMAKLFSQRHNYPVDHNQELLANGLSAVFGAFFCSFTPSTSPARCFLMESTGGRTQVAYVISALLALLTMLVIAPLFESLPVCVLSCIIFVACMPLFPHLIAFLGYLKTDRYDLAIWLFTTVSTLMFSVDTSLLIGMVFSLILMHFRMQRPATCELSINEDDMIFLNKKRYSKCAVKEGMTLFRFEAPIYFATLDVFKERLSKTTISLAYLKSRSIDNGSQMIPLPTVIVDNTDIPLQLVENEGSPSEAVIQNELNHLEMNSSAIESRDGVPFSSPPDQDNHINKDVTPALQAEKPLPTSIVVDCSAVPFVDTSGAKLLAHLHSEYSNFNIRFLLANCCGNVIKQLKRIDQCKNLVSDSVFPSIQDVIVAVNDSI